MNSFKEKNNEHYARRKRFLSNQRKKRKFDEMVRRNYKPHRKNFEGDEEEENEGSAYINSKRYIGHQKEIEIRRRKIEENRQKDLGSEFLTFSKKLGREKAKSMATLDKKHTSTSTNMSKSRKDLTSKYSNNTKHKDYLDEMRKRKLNMSQLQILQKKIEEDKATKKEEMYFERVKLNYFNHNL